MSETAGLIADESPHWFAIPGEQNGRRSIDEQMTGLHPALAEVKGRTVFDMGCAEGMIAQEFARAGARVYAVDYRREMIETAQRVVEGVTFELVDLRDAWKAASRAGKWRRFHIVLALAVVHKLDDPKRGTEFVAESCDDLAIFRLPLGSTGLIRAKHGGASCDVNKVMQERGFRLEKTLKGPREELVCYWRRRA